MCFPARGCKPPEGHKSKTTIAERMNNRQMGQMQKTQRRTSQTPSLHSNQIVNRDGLEPKWPRRESCTEVCVALLLRILFSGTSSRPSPQVQSLCFQSKPKIVESVLCGETPSSQSCSASESNGREEALPEVPALPPRWNRGTRAPRDDGHYKMQETYAQEAILAPCWNCPRGKGRRHTGPNNMGSRLLQQQQERNHEARQYQPADHGAGLAKLSSDDLSPVLTVGFIGTM